MMTKIRRSNHVFISWKGDHSPKHVHVYRDSILVLKWDLESDKAMKGKPSEKVLALIRGLQKEGPL